MKRILYCIRDNLSGFGTPVFDVSDQTAKRAFSYAINNNPDMNFSPSDYDLYKVGTFDSETGLFAATESGLPELVVKGSSVFNISNK